MAKKANTTMIGGFVVIAIFLLAASVVILGSGKFFKQTTSFVLFFDGSIKGLNVGAPVLLRGVQVGSVSSISLRVNREKLTMNIPVVIEIIPARVTIEDTDSEARMPEEVMEIMVEWGLRAVLSTQSLITGQLAIDLEYFPNTSLNLKKSNLPYPEIPTIPSTAERFFQVLQDSDISGMVADIESALAGINALVNDAGIAEAVTTLNATMKSAETIAGKFDSRVDVLFDSLDATVTEVDTLVAEVRDQVRPLSGDMREVMENIKGLTVTITDQVAPLSGVVTDAVAVYQKLAVNLDRQLSGLLDSLNTTLAGVHGVVSEDTPLIVQLEQTLASVALMAKSFRQLADYLEQHPEALLRGKIEQ
jgi:paraquat-inducible protein B